MKKTSATHSLSQNDKNTEQKKLAKKLLSWHPWGLLTWASAKKVAEVLMQRGLRAARRAECGRPLPRRAAMRSSVASGFRDPATLWN